MNWRRSILLRLVVTGQAVIRSVALLMTLNTKAHGVIDHALSDCHLGNVPMAGGTLYLSPNVWRMVKSDMSFLRPSIHTLPGNLLASLLVGGEFLNFGLIRCNGLVTHHAVLNTG